MGQQVKVIAQTGNTVNLRSRASTSATVLEYVKVGTTVEVQSEAAGWKQVVTPSGKTGWMKSEFLSEDDDLQNATDVEDPDAGENEPESEPESEVVQIPRADWEAFLEAMERLLQAMGS